MYLFRSSGPLTEINLRFEAAAAAPTMWVFPQPGGPYSKMFERSLRGDCENMWVNFDGNSRVCLQGIKRLKKKKKKRNKDDL
jgi:hypothetical protein